MKTIKNARKIMILYKKYGDEKDTTHIKNIQW